MNKIFHHLTLKKVVFSLVLGVAFVSLGAMRSVTADDGTINGDEHMVTIYDRGDQRTLITKANTIRGALDQAGISVESKDIVEPGLDDQLVAQRYNVNIYRARPVTVEDGAKELQTVTAAQTPEKIAEAAAVKLYPEDKTTISRVDDVVEDGGAGLKMSIQRATPFTFVLYGKTLSDSRTQAKTVGDMLSEKHVTLSKDDGTSVPLSTPITAGMTVNVWRNGVQTITQEEAIPAPVQQVKDQDRDVGYKAVQTPGVPGKKQVTYEINMQNGVEVSRKVIQEVQTLAPVNEVDVIGAKVISGDVSADKASVMAAAGISASDYGYVDYIVGRESGWCATKWQGEYGGCPAYHGTPGAGVGYGLCQATPGSKMASAGADWATNAVTQMSWCNSYAVSRYGGWYGAYQHWVASHNW